MIVRETTEDDIDALRAILNDIIKTGGTTAIETGLSSDAFRVIFFTNPGKISCLTALDDANNPVGFQALERKPTLPDDCADIATYSRRNPSFPGVGRALFARSQEIAREAGCTAINASIRSDNEPGLAYYSKIGFVDHAVDEGVPLKDGTPIDRISKRFTL